MNNYSLTLILDGKATPAKKKAAIEKISAMVKAYDGTLGEINDMGERDLAYQIGKRTTGIYLNLPISMDGNAAKKFVDKVRLEDYVVRYLMIKNEVSKKELPKKIAKKAKK